MVTELVTDGHLYPPHTAADRHGVRCQRSVPAGGSVRGLTLVVIGIALSLFGAGLPFILFITAYGGFLYEPLAVQALAFGVAAASFVGGIALTLTGAVSAAGIAAASGGNRESRLDGITADRRSQPRAGIGHSVRSQTSVESEECVLVVEGEVRPLTADDVPWMVEMMASRRALYETFSPVFWKPSPNAREVHRPYLASCVTSDRHCGFRTDDAFILGEAQDAGAPPWWSDVTLGFVDDFAVSGGARWAGAGATLLGVAWRELARRGVATLRVVTGRRDTPKVAMLESVGLTVGESWWIVLGEGESSPDASYGPMTRDGVEGLNIPAPPVYDAHRPALLVTSIHPHAVEKLPAIAAELGAGLAIVPTKPADQDLIAAVRSAGFDEVTRYYVGTPSHP